MRRGLRADRARVGFGREQDAHRPLPLGDGAGAVSGRVDRVDVGPDGAAIVHDYKGRGRRAARSGPTAAAPGRALPARRPRAARARAGGRALPAARREQARPRGLVRAGVPGALHPDRRRRRGAFAAALEGARAGRADHRGAHEGPTGRARSAARPAAAAIPASAAAASRRARCRHEEHPRAARRDRGPRPFLAPGRGRGIGQDRGDGRALRRGVLARRRRRRLDPDADLHREGGRRAARAHPAPLHRAGEDEEARAVDAAWIGTIHGFCARVLRSQPLAAGLDPRFVVLDEAAARRLASTAFETALETG